ncbi:MAG: amidophosphoribosyltransferase [Balneolaceae bacterium]|nr:MAG: amidophosphoribosyltransferase [Balneolaceae bacterium]
MILPFLIDKPVLLLDEQRCKNNIQRIFNKAKKSGCTFRPHFKTHQSNIIGKWFRDAGVRGITVSSISMAEYFIEDGWNDITIAFPFFPAQINRLQMIEKNADLRLFIHSAEHLGLLDRELSHPFKFYIEINPGFGRSGVHFNDIKKIKNIITASEKFEHCTFHGFYIHDGRTYQAKNREQILSKAEVPLMILQSLKKKFPGFVTSIGDTPSASVIENFDNIDELTPGNFVFYDWMQVQTGSCSLHDVALFVMLPVAQITEPGRAIVHGGAVHLSKEFLNHDNSINFGQIIHYSAGPDIKKADGYVSAVSQEHGTILYSDKNFIPRDAICVCPIHSCLTANLFSEYHLPDGQTISKRILS